MERATYTTKSFIIALALVFRSVTPEQAALAASVEVNSQIERWGEVEDSKYGFFCTRFRSKGAARSYANSFSLRTLAHDVDYHDVRRHLSSAASLVCGPSKVA